MAKHKQRRRPAHTRPPLEQLEALAAKRATTRTRLADIDNQIRTTIHQCRTDGVTLTQIGEALGVTYQAVQQHWLKHPD